MEKEYKVKPIGVKFVCDHCDKGEMFPNGNNKWNGDVPLIEHECNNCTIKTILNEKYPLIRYIIVESQ